MRQVFQFQSFSSLLEKLLLHEEKRIVRVKQEREQFFCYNTCIFI